MFFHFFLHLANPVASLNSIIKNVKKWIHITKYQVMENLINYFL